MITNRISVQVCVFSFTIDRDRCRVGVSPDDWCNVRVDNLLDLERIRGDELDLSIRHTTPICMDKTIARTYFNATFLEPTAGHPPISIIIVSILVISGVIGAIAFLAYKLFFH